MRAFDQLRTAAENTPADRERHVDLIRAVSIWAVVLGHWLAVAVTGVDGQLDGVNALAVLDWTHPLTWLFQVMPLFFLVGGYANAASLHSHEQGDGDALGWVLGRYDRLLRPTTVVLAAVAGGVLVARALGVDQADAATAAWFATVPLWFLLVYLAVVAVAPWALRAHRRWGLIVPLVMTAVVAAGDFARLSLQIPWVGDINYLAAWMAIHQLGFSWRDGTLAARAATGAPLAAVGCVALLLLTVVGPYPVSMVGVPGEAVDNTAPPTLALLALALAQVGVALALRDICSRWLQRRRVWTLVIAVNSVILTLFLWHMAAAIAAAVALYPTGVLPIVALDTTLWWWLRVPWVAACLLGLTVLVALFGPVERSVPGTRKQARVGGGGAAWLVAAGILATLTGLSGLALAGRGVHGPAGLPSEALIAYAVGVALLAWVGHGPAGSPGVRAPSTIGGTGHDTESE